MKLIEKPIYFDVDETIILKHLVNEPLVVIEDKSDNSIKHRTPHYKHIELLKRYKSRGYDIVLWSGNGQLWAESVRDALKLQDYVDLCIAKPLRYVDDLDFSEWSGGRIYIENK